jgi:hypothetical protein
MSTMTKKLTKSAESVPLAADPVFLQLYCAALTGAAAQFEIHNLATQDDCDQACRYLDDHDDGIEERAAWLAKRSYKLALHAWRLLPERTISEFNAKL